MEVFTHEDTFLSDVIVKIFNILQECIGNHLKSIFGPRLNETEISKIFITVDFNIDSKMMSII